MYFFLFLLFFHCLKCYTFAVLSDPHVGETHLQESYLLNAVNLINKLAPMNNISFVLITGDLTHFGFVEMFNKAERILRNLTVPYYPIPGGNDVGVFTLGQVHFRDTFSKILNKTQHYTGETAVKVKGNDVYLQNWMLRFDSVVFLSLDWVKRKVIDSKNTENIVEFYNYTKIWYENRLKEISKDKSITEIVFLQNIPFILPYFYLFVTGVIDFQHTQCFKVSDIDYFENLLVDYFPRKIDQKRIYGVLSGKYHVWDFQEPFNQVTNFVQYETKACKLDSSFALFTVANGKITKFDKYNARILRLDFILFEFVGYVGFIIIFIFLLINYVKVTIFPIVSYIICPFYAFNFFFFQTNYWKQMYQQGYLLQEADIAGEGWPFQIAIYFAIILFIFMQFTNFLFLRQHKVHFIKPVVDAGLFCVYYFINFNPLEFADLLLVSKYLPPEDTIFRDSISFSAYLFLCIFWFSFFSRNFCALFKFIKIKFDKEISKKSEKFKLVDEKEEFNEVDYEKTPLIEQFVVDVESTKEETLINDISSIQIDKTPALILIHKRKRRKKCCYLVLIYFFELTASIISGFLSYFVTLVSFIIFKYFLILVGLIFSSDLVESVFDNILCYALYITAFIVIIIFQSIEIIRIKIEDKKRNQILVVHIIFIVFLSVFNLWWFAVAVVRNGFNLEMFLIEILVGLPFLLMFFVIKNFRDFVIKMKKRSTKKVFYVS